MSEIASRTGKTDLARPDSHLEGDMTAIGVKRKSRNTDCTHKMSLPFKTL